MAKTDSTGSGWRYRWAHRQNDKRRDAYRNRDAAWRRRDDELRRLRAAADEIQGSPEAGAGLPMELGPGEVVFRTVPGAQLVEVQHGRVLPAPDLTVDPRPHALRPGRPDGTRVTDAGIVVLTNRRVVLLGGRGRRDWAYGRMTGLSHDPNVPVTLMQVLDRRRTSGLMLPVAEAADFRFILTLAFADAIEQRQAVVEQLDELIAEHDQLRPIRPPIATPSQAHLSALVPGGRRTIAVAAAVALIVPAALVESDEPTRTGVEAAVAATPAATRAAAAPAPPAIAPVPAPTPSPSSTVSAKPRRTTTTAPKTPPSTERLCGAPANPWGYDFCGGNRIRRPAGKICDVFDCVPDFWEGDGYLVQCRDGTISLTGGQRGACAGQQGVRRTVWT